MDESVCLSVPKQAGVLDRFTGKCRLGIDILERLKLKHWGQPVGIVGLIDLPAEEGTRPSRSAGIRLLATVWPLSQLDPWSDSRRGDLGSLDLRVFMGNGTGADDDHYISERLTMWSTSNASLSESDEGTDLMINCKQSDIVPLEFVPAVAIEVRPIMQKHVNTSDIHGIWHDKDDVLKSKLVEERLNGFVVAEGAVVLMDSRYYFKGLVLSVVSTTPESSFVTPVCVADNTEINVLPSVKERIPRVRFTTEKDISIIGLDSEFETLCELVKLPLLHESVFARLGVKCPKGVLLFGQPGTGKTLLVRNVAEQCSASLTVINGPDLFAPYLGESEANLRRAFEAATLGAADGPAILFIDEIDALCPRREDDKSHENRMVAQLLTLMDGMVARERLFVIAATNRPNTLDPALRRPGRFDREVEIGPPSPTARKTILEYYCRSLSLHGDIDLEKIAKRTVGFVGADLAALVREAALCGVQRLASRESPTSIVTKDEMCAEMDECAIKLSDFDIALGHMVAASRRDNIVNVGLVEFEDIGGLVEVKQRLMENALWPLMYPSTYEKLGIKPPRGILLHGPPGCAKTTLVKALSRSAQASFFSLSGAEILSPYLGDAEKTVRDLFRKARSATPAIIFLDEIDAMVGNRSQNGDSNGVQERILATLLTEMDGIEAAGHVLVVGATNRLDKLDAAFTRPGRIDQIIYVPLPDEEGRLSILQVKTLKMPLSDDIKSKVDLVKLAARTTGYSGAELENLCREAAILALRSSIDATQITMEHFNLALQSVER